MRKLAGVTVLDATDRSPADLAREVERLWLRTPA
jgi:hypothetical protein